MVIVSVAKQRKSSISKWRPRSAVVVELQPKLNTHHLTKVGATVLAVLSLVGTTSPYHVERSTHVSRNEYALESDRSTTNA